PLPKSDPSGGCSAEMRGEESMRFTVDASLNSANGLDSGRAPGASSLGSRIAHVRRGSRRVGWCSPERVRPEGTPRFAMKWDRSQYCPKTGLQEYCSGRLPLLL